MPAASAAPDGGFRKFIVEPSQVRIFGFVYLYPDNRNPDMDPVKYVRSFMKRTGETVATNRDILLGVKLQVGSNMNGRYSYDFLKIARELCDTYQIPLMAHISFAPPETDQVMELMKPGDIITHCYNRHTLGILDEAGKVKQSVREARAAAFCSMSATGSAASTSKRRARRWRTASSPIPSPPTSTTST